MTTAASSTTPAPAPAPRRFATVLLLLPMLVVMAFNAYTLWPEIAIPAPSLNDDAVHYLVVERASEALANGENPVDHWLPELELGFPMFRYYQQLPQLTVVFLHRLLFERVDLLTLFNAIRYAILVLFPLVVLWSMRRMEFSAVAAAVAAAAAGLISGNGNYGFEYGSYVWRGHGMYTQLWAMPLAFASLACLYRVANRGTGYAAAVFTCSAMALSHLIYSYMLAITAIVVVLMGMDRQNYRARHRTRGRRRGAGRDHQLVRDGAVRPRQGLSRGQPVPAALEVRLVRRPRSPQVARDRRHVRRRPAPGADGAPRRRSGGGDLHARTSRPAGAGAARPVARHLLRPADVGEHARRAAAARGLAVPSHGRRRTRRGGPAHGHRRRMAVAPASPGARALAGRGGDRRAADPPGAGPPRAARALRLQHAVAGAGPARDHRRRRRPRDPRARSAACPPGAPSPGSGPTGARRCALATCTSTIS